MHIIFSARCDYSSRSSIEYLSNINAYTDPSACLNINKLQMLDRVPPYQRSNEYILVWIVSHKARKLLNILSLPPPSKGYGSTNPLCVICARAPSVRSAITGGCRDSRSSTRETLSRTDRRWWRTIDDGPFHVFAMTRCKSAYKGNFTLRVRWRNCLKFHARNF